MAAYGRAAESGELRPIYPDRRTRCGAYEHGADGGRGDTQSPYDHCERRILAEWHGPSADNRNVCKGAWPLRARSPLALADGRNRQDDGDAGATTRGPSTGDAAEGTPACWGRRGYHDLSRKQSGGSFDLPRTVAAARRHSARDR